MSKQLPPDYTTHAEEHPPPYTLAGDSLAPSTGHDAPTIPGLFSSHLNSLRDRIIAQEEYRSSTREQLDNETLSLLVPYIEELLSSIVELDPAPASVENILVPDSAVGKDWVYSDSTERGKGELRRVVKVQRDTKLGGDEKMRVSPPRSSLLDSSLSLDAPREFSSWGRWDEGGSSSSAKPRSALWWDDEDMAIRLAKSLQPAKKVDRATVAQNTTQARAAAEKKPSRFGGLLRRDLPVPSMVGRGRAAQQQEQEEDVIMNVTAQEVTFRRENEMGIWESCRGFGIVVMVKIKKS